MRNHLSRYINQKGFHSQFKPVKKLGKGNFASVYQAVRVEDGRKFAVKAFSKTNIYNTENGK
jgi:serine/threonine protein kinase